MATFEEYVITLKDHFSSGLKGANTAMGGFKSKIASVNSQINGMGVAFAGVALGAFGAKMISLGSDFEETSGKFNVVFRDVADQANRTARELEDSYGLSSLASRQLLSDTGDLLSGFGFSGDAALDLSTEVQKLAVDLASFTNYEGGAKGASEALTKALLGEREQVKMLGIAILEEDVKARVKQLEAMGKVNGMTERQKKAYATLSIAQEQSKNAIGDYARTSDSFANTVKSLKMRFEDISVVVGQTLIPIIRPLVNWLGKVAGWVKDNQEKFKAIVKAIVAVTAVLGGLIVSLKILNFVMSINPVGAIIAGIAALTAGFVYLWNTSEGFRGTLMGLWEAIKQVGEVLRLYFIEGFKEALSGLKSLGQAFVSLIKGNFADAAKAAKEGVMALAGTKSKKAAWEAGLKISDKFKEGYAKGVIAEDIKLPGALGGMGNMSGGAGAMGGGAGSGMSAIATNEAKVTGAAPKVFNINIAQLTGIENFVNSKGSVSESKQDISKILMDAMLGMLADVQLSNV